MSAIHIYRATGTHYRVRTRRLGFRKWHILKGKFRTERAAFLAMGRELAKDQYKRGEVLLCADWYDPAVILEARKP